MANNYWNEKHEALCQALKVSGISQIEISRIFKALQPALREMAENIMQRYFSIPVARQREIIEDLMLFVFMKIISHYDVNRKAYSFCGTVIRNRCHELIVRQPSALKVVQLEFTDDTEKLDDSHGINYGSHFEMDLRKAKKTIEEKRVKLRKSLKKQKRVSAYMPKNSKYQRMLEMLDLIEEYITKFPDSLDGYGLVDYLSTNSGLNKSSIGAYLGILYNINSRGIQDDLETKDEIKKFSILQDDYVPNDDKNSKRNRQRIMHNTYNNGEYDYF